MLIKNNATYFLSTFYLKHTRDCENTEVGFGKKKMSRKKFFLLFDFNSVFP